MRYRSGAKQQYGYRVKYRYKGKPMYTSPFKTRGEAERWKRRWEADPRHPEYSGDSVAHVVADVQPITTPTKGYVQQWRVQSHSDPSKYYTVSLKADGTYECSCPQWICRRHKECKHIREVKRNTDTAKTYSPSKDYVIDANGVKQGTLF